MLAHFEPDPPTDQNKGMNCSTFDGFLWYEFSRIFGTPRILEKNTIQKGRRIIKRGGEKAQDASRRFEI